MEAEAAKLITDMWDCLMDLRAFESVEPETRANFDSISLRVDDVLLKLRLREDKKNESSS